MIAPAEIHPSGADLAAQVEGIFSATGILSRSKNFEFRPPQQDMAVAVARALQNREHLAVEAGTGVGKSLAYLVPAILFAVARKKKAIVSTHTINLQEQLTEKDLPMLAGVLGALPEPVRFSYAMLKGRANYLCTRRLQKAMQQSGNLFTSSEAKELQRIYEWSKQTKDGSLSDFEFEPDPKVWAQVCSERGLCSPKTCGHQSDFAKHHDLCFFQRVRNRILSADVVILNHTLFFTLLGGIEEEPEGGILFKNDFVIFDEAHTMESVASRHIGLSVSSAQVRWSLNRLWNPKTQKGLLATLAQGGAVKLVADILEEADRFFDNVEHACETIQAEAKKNTFGGGDRKRAWTELRIRRAELVGDNVALPLQRLRAAISDLVKTSNDQEIGQELIECNRRLGELKEEVAEFLGQSAPDHVYWVERTGKTQRHLALNAAPVDVADFLRRRLFATDTSVIMTSATLGIRNAEREVRKEADKPGSPRPHTPLRSPSSVLRSPPSALTYFARRVGCESATQLQVGTPYDYERQMKLYTVKKMPDPREPGYADGAGTLDRAFREADARQGVRAVYQLQADAGGGGTDAAIFRPAQAGAVRAGHRHPALHHAGKIQGGRGLRAVWHGQLLAGRGCARRSAEQCHHHPPAVRRAGSSAHRGADRGDRGARRQFLRRIFAAGSHPEIPPGRRPADSRQNGHRHRRGVGQPHSDQAIRPGLSRRPAQVPGGNRLSQTLAGRLQQRSPITSQFFHAGKR